MPSPRSPRPVSRDRARPGSHASAGSRGNPRGNPLARAGAGTRLARAGRHTRDRATPGRNTRARPARRKPAFKACSFPSGPDGLQQGSGARALLGAARALPGPVGSRVRTHGARAGRRTTHGRGQVGGQAGERGLGSARTQARAGQRAHTRERALGSRVPFPPGRSRRPLTPMSRFRPATNAGFPGWAARPRHFCRTFRPLPESAYSRRSASPFPGIAAEQPPETTTFLSRFQGARQGPRAVSRRSSVVVGIQPNESQGQPKKVRPFQPRLSGVQPRNRDTWHAVCTTSGCHQTGPARRGREKATTDESQQSGISQESERNRLTAAPRSLTLRTPETRTDRPRGWAERHHA